MWRKARKALRLNLCVYVPTTGEENDVAAAGGGAYSRIDSAADGADGFSDVSSPAAAEESSTVSEVVTVMPTTPTFGGLRRSKSSSKSSKKKCVICFGSMKPGDGHALFTAECSHTFHFSCIASNVKHGNFVCPVCRAIWKQIPRQEPLSTEQPHGRLRINLVNLHQENPPMTVVRRFSRDSSNRQYHQFPSYFPSSEPNTFNDDEPLSYDTTTNFQHGLPSNVDIKTYAEFSAVGESDTEENFGVLVHLRAPHASIEELHGHNVTANGEVSQTRAPIDLVTVLDVSGSMAGTKLALLKRAMGFVIQNLGPSDRLSVVSFSSAARRLFPLRHMTDSGRQHALQAVNSLTSSGGTNIAEGLRKGAKVIEERKERNPVSSIILLSDGQDTYTLHAVLNSSPNYSLLVPSVILEATSNQIPVHSFGFGTDHDSAAMHAIAQISSGTYSFIESENVIQDAFAQCIGGLLSVVVQDMQLSVECVHPGVRLAPINSGSFANEVTNNGRTGLIKVGDLYADEERDFLISVNVPPASHDIVLLKVSCQYRNPVSNGMVILEDIEVRVERPSIVLSRSVSIEVDRERNRIDAAEAMAVARASAERGDFSEAVAVLERSRGKLSESLAWRSGDWLCASLDDELKEMQDRMASRHQYEVSGRAYLLSGISSHTSQRATTRGSLIHSGSFHSVYQTPSMSEMLQRSQALLPGGPTTILPSQDDSVSK